MKKILLLLLFSALLVGCAKSPKYIIQVSLGGWDKADYTADEIIGRLDSVSRIIPLKDVIIGWTADADIYREVGSYLHGKGIGMLLWMPVFAETEDVCDNTPAVDLWGRLPGSYSLTEDEGFRFNCPSNPDNIGNVIDLYDSLFADCGFDGVFLDRIRTQSFVCGIGGVLNCGCPICEERFKEEGVSLADVRAAWEDMGDVFLSVTGYTPEDGFRFANPLAADFFEAKGRIVSGSVAAVADSLRARGLRVGMDLYAPFMAPFVGQDYSVLAPHADFIKPMLYRCTFAPAGMGFEYGLLRSSIPGAFGYPSFGMDVDFLNSQLDAMAPYPCDKFPGIEINYREGIVPTSPEYVRESVQAVLDHHFNGAVLSWNIMEAPVAHIKAVAVR